MVACFHFSNDMLVDSAMLSASIAIPPFLIRVSSNEATNSHDSSKTILLEMRKHDNFDSLCRKPTYSLPDVFNLTITGYRQTFSSLCHQQRRSCKMFLYPQQKKRILAKQTNKRRRFSLFDIYILPFSFLIA